MAEDEPGVGERAKEGPAPVTQAQFKTIMDALSTLRAEIKTSAEDTADSVSRRIKREGRLPIQEERSQVAIRIQRRSVGKSRRSGLSPEEVAGDGPS